MNNVNQTLYIPLYGKAYVSRKGIILNDKKAEIATSYKNCFLSIPQRNAFSFKNTIDNQ